MWCPPTPPQQDTDVYIDQTMSFLYDMNLMSESQLPPVYVKKDAKRTRHEAGFVDSRRPLKIPRKEDTINAPKSLFHSAALLKMKRELKLQKYRGLMRSSVPPLAGKPAIVKPVIETPLWHDWTIHEDMAILKVIQTFQGLPVNLLVTSPGQTPNWDFVSDYVNSVSITYRSPKQCRHRYESVLLQREEGKQVFDSSLRKKKNKNVLQKFQFHKSTRPMRTSQLYTQDNNSSFSQIMMKRYDSLKATAAGHKRIITQRALSNNPLLKNPKHIAVLNDCGIDLDRPVFPTEVAARLAEKGGRLAREKKPMTPEQQQQIAKLQLMKALPLTQTGVNQVTTSVATSTPVTLTQTIVVSSVAASGVSQTGSPGGVRSQRIIASPLQGPTVVSVSGLSPAQLQAATQRLIVSGSPGQSKTEGVVTGLQGKSISPAQLQLIRQQSNLKQHIRLQAGQSMKPATVTLQGQQAVVQLAQAQPRPQFSRQGTVTVAGKTGITRNATETEVSQLLLKKHQLQQQKTMGAVVSQTTNIQGVSQQVLAQAGTSGSPVATLVKAVSNTGGVTQTVTIPVSGVTLQTTAKGIMQPARTANPQQLRQVHIHQQQLLGQKKLAGQKLNLAQMGGKNNVQAQLIVGSKPLSTAMTVQQFTQVMRGPLGLTARGTPMVLAKGTPTRVIPVNTPQGTKQTIQVVFFCVLFLVSCVEVSVFFF